MLAVTDIFGPLEDLQWMAEERGINPTGNENKLRCSIYVHGLMRVKATRNTSQLDGLQEVIASLEAAKNPYVCVGSLPLSSFTILVASESSEKAATTYAPVHFPLKNESAIQPLIDAAKPAAFKPSASDVLDPSYPEALALHPNRFGITPAFSLEPHILGIVQSITEILIAGLGPPKDSRKIVAVLDNLTIHSEGRFSKAHADMPRSPNVFGTLLINLPVAHEGGQLIVRAPETHSVKNTPEDISAQEGGNSSTREEYVTDWGKANSIDWIAFHEDCEYEELPVTHGNRVTLSYTLSFITPLNEEEGKPVDVEVLAGSKDLDRQRVIDALKAPDVLTEARPRLCFYLQHKYPINCDNPELESLPSRRFDQKLKGRDAMLYHALQAMDAKISVHLVFPLSYRAVEDEEWEHCGESDDEAITEILPAGVTPKPQWSRPEGDVESLLKSRKARTPEELRAVEVTPNSTQFVKLSFAAYGNHPQRDTIYGSVCLIASRHHMKPEKGLHIPASFFGE